MRLFAWLAVGPIPAAMDLRRLGWRLVDKGASAGEVRGHPLLITSADLTLAQWLRLAGASPEVRRWAMMVGVDEPQERARLLRLGFGDAQGPELGLEELESRVIRLIENAAALPRHRHCGPLRLDLLRREAFVAGRAVGLHPREFALLWRLADQPGKAVSPIELLGDVWRLSFRPETNSLAVHISRLRAKLRLAGLEGLIETRPDGSYRLAREQFRPLVAAPAPVGELELDAHVRIREEPDGNQQLIRDENHAA